MESPKPQPEFDWAELDQTIKQHRAEGMRAAGVKGGFTAHEFSTQRGISSHAGHSLLRALLADRIVERIGFRYGLDKMGRGKRIPVYDLVRKKRRE